MKRKAIRLASAVSVCVIIIGVMIDSLMALYGRGILSDRTFIIYLSWMYSFFQDSIIVWSVMIFAVMLMTGRLSFKEMVIFSFATCIGYAMLDKLVWNMVSSTNTPIGVSGWFSRSQSIGAYYYPVFFIAVLCWSMTKKDRLVGWISLLWLVLDQMVYPVCYGLRISEIVTGAVFGYLYDVIFVCAPVFMIIFIVHGRFREKSRI